jgi:hypothetical protein
MTDVTRIPEEQWVEFPAAGAITREVRAAARMVPLSVRTDDSGSMLVCLADTQSVLRLSTAKGPYAVRIREIEAATLTHMIQAHGWTRERSVVSDQGYRGG